jgi:hypothetical protein
MDAAERSGRHLRLLPTAGPVRSLVGTEPTRTPFETSASKMRQGYLKQTNSKAPSKEEGQSHKYNDPKQINSVLSQKEGIICRASAIELPWPEKECHWMCGSMEAWLVHISSW